MVEFTVLIPVYNTPAIILREAMESIQKQTLKPNHILIVDDGSTSLETINELERWCMFAKIHTLDKNRGVSHALNVGHGLIETEWIALMGSDDVSHERRFEKQVDFIKTKKRADVVGTQLKAFFDHDPDRKAKFISTHTSRPMPGKGWQTNHGTVMYRNQAVKDVGGYNVDIKKGQDVDIFNRMMKAGKVFYNLHDNLYSWRRYLKQ